MILSPLVIAESTKKLSADSKFGSISIDDCSGILNGVNCFLGTQILTKTKQATYTLDKVNSDIIDSSAEGTATIYSDSQLFYGKQFYDVNGNQVAIKDSQYYIAINNTYTKDVTDYVDCLTYKDCLDTKNLTEKDISNLKQADECIKGQKQYPIQSRCEKGSHKEDYIVSSWIPYNGEVLKAGVYSWRLEAKRPINQKIDFVLVTPFKDKFDNNIKTDEWAWLNATWQYRKGITIQGWNTTITNMTVVVNVSMINGKMNPDWSDIRFTNNASSPSQLVYYQIKNYGTTALYKVKVDSLASGNNTLIYMYYGNTSAVATAQNGSLIYDNLIAYYTFENSSIWSTNNKLAGSYVGAATNSSATGVYGGSGYFNGAGNYATLPDSADYNYGLNNFTINVWVYPTSSTRRITVLASPSSFYWFCIDICYAGVSGCPAGKSGVFDLYASSTGSDWKMFNGDTGGNAIATRSIPTSQWNQFIVSRTGSRFVTYINGTQDLSLVNASSIMSKAEVRQIGRTDGANWDISAYFDEFVIINESWSNEKASRDYQNQNMSNFGFGVEEVSDVSVPQFSNPNFYPANNTEYISRTYDFNVTVTSTNGSVYLLMNGTRYNANNVSNIYYVDINNLLVGNYTYNWSAYGNGTNNILNNTQNYNYVVQQNYPPTINFVSQSTPDINSFNLFGNPLNITYNVTDVSGVNASSVLFYYKTNNSLNDCSYFVNGVQSCGYLNTTMTNQSLNFSVSLFDNQIYPATYNINERGMELTPHSIYTLSTAVNLLKARFYNISNSTTYGFLETNIKCDGSANIYYCNSSYSNMDVTNTANCIQFDTIDSTNAVNHTHTIYSNHTISPFPINTTSGKVGSVIVTPTSYIIYQDSLVSNCYLGYITNDTGTIQTSGNIGLTYSNLAGTLDAHIHQFSGTDTLNYYMCAKDNLNYQNCSNVRSDLLDLAGLPPSSPDIYNPINTYYNRNININYTPSISPNGYMIVNYNISLFNSDLSFNRTIISNNSVNLSYIWDSSNITYGTFYIGVRAVDNLSQSSIGYSSSFIIDNQNPNWITIPNNQTINYLDSFNAIFNATDASGISSYFVNDSMFTIDNQGNLTNNTGLAAGTYIVNVSVNDTTGNINYTLYKLIINPISTSLSISNNPTITYPTAAGVTGSGCPAQLTCNLYYTLGFGANPYYAVSNPDNTIYTAGKTYTFVYNTTGNQNYTSNATTSLLSVLKNPSTCSMLFNITTPQTYPVKFLAYTDCDTNYTLTRDGNSISNNVTQDLPAGVYNFTVQRLDNQNYTNAGQEQDFTINQASANLSLTSSNGWNIGIGEATTVTGSGCPAQLTCQLYRDGILKSNPYAETYITLASYIFVYNSTSNINYSGNTQTQSLSVSTSPTRTGVTICRQIRPFAVNKLDTLILRCS